MNSYLKHIVLGILLLALYSCAQPGYLSGGDKDVTSPNVAVEDTTSMRKKEFPPNQSIQFSSDRIEIHFDELIAIKDEKKQIVITPALETAPIFEIKGKKLFVIFESKPQPNTTYIINFGDAIRDVTEGNIFSNYKYVFSTGSYIDSLQYQSHVIDAVSKAPVANVWVMLYQELADSIPLQEKPYYFAKTNANGNCVIENIAAGTYKSFVLDDQNSNYRYDQAKERIGFNPTSINLQDSVTVDTFSLFTNYTNKSKITDVSILKNGHLIIPLPQSANDSLNFTEGLLSYFWQNSLQINETKDTISGWIKPQQKETKGVKFVAKNYQSTTFKASQPTDTLVQFTTNGSRKLKPGEKLILNFSQPIEKIYKDKFELLVNDSVSDFQFTKNETEITFDIVYDPESSYVLNVLPNAITTIYDNTNDSLSIFFNVAEPNDFGNVLLNIELANTEDIIIELLDMGKTVQRIKLGNISTSEVKFENLEPKPYNIRIIFDANHNGIWDTGNYFNNIQPEKIAYYTDPIVVRKGWDLDLTWLIK